MDAQATFSYSFTQSDLGLTFEPYRESHRQMALSGAFWEGFVADPDSQKQLTAMLEPHCTIAEKRGKSGRGTQGCELRNRDGIDDRRTGAVRGVLALLKTLAERLGVAVVLVSHATSGVFKSRQHRRLSERTRSLSAGAGSTRSRPEKALPPVRKMESATWRPRNHRLIAFKDASCIKDCRAVMRHDLC